MSATTTIVGRLTRDPELRFSQSGKAVASFTVARNDRRYDKSTGQWADSGETLFLTCTAFSALAEGAAENLKKGDSVIVVGKLQQRSYEKDGQKRVVVELLADAVGADVKARKAMSLNSPAEEMPAW